MTRNRSKARFWTLLSIVNLLTLAYTFSMLFCPGTEEASVIEVIDLCGVGLVLAVADMIMVLLAYSASY